eukprot:gb/GECG01003314.1/.p1 GENE.gb/GECG01003314.1/~~gb/GECG01003314.1/.p1  ORF type:complete len:404 (+),score=67.25 gb/GECG01003314.1/:1-1212(+)
MRRTTRRAAAVAAEPEPDNNTHEDGGTDDAAVLSTQRPQNEMKSMSLKTKRRKSKEETSSTESTGRKRGRSTGQDKSSSSSSASSSSSKKKKTGQPKSIVDVYNEEPVDYTGIPEQWKGYPKNVIDAYKRRNGGPLRLYSDGIFDMFHYGHAKALRQAKEAFPYVYLLVGCNSDSMTHQYKGRTVMSDFERYESLRHCRWVDEVIEDAPWIVDDDFLRKHDIDFVCHDDLPYGDATGQSSSGDVYAHLKSRGMFWPTQRTEGISTSDLIIRIIKQYDDFIRRNMTRGYSGKEMNVPFVKEKQIQFDLALDKAKNATQTFLRKWSDKAEEFQFEFLNLFSKEGQLRKRWRETRQGLRGRFDHLFHNPTDGESEQSDERGDDASSSSSGNEDVSEQNGKVTSSSA